LDRNFFIAEIETCPNMMYRVAWSILQNEADVQDALQDAVLKAWEKRDKLREEKYFRTWMTRILINVCYLSWLFRQITAANHNFTDDFLEKLMPWSEQAQENC